MRLVNRGLLGTVLRASQVGIPPPPRFRSSFVYPSVNSSLLSTQNLVTKALILQSFPKMLCLACFSLSLLVSPMHALHPGPWSVSGKVRGIRYLCLLMSHTWYAILYPVSLLQLRSDFAMERMLQDTQRVVCRNHGSCWGGGTGRVLMSVELERVNMPRL